MDSFIFNGVNSEDFGIYLDAPAVYDSPKRRTASVAVPGRNGNLTIDQGAFDNVTTEYNCYISDDLLSNIRGFRAFISRSAEYHRLENTFEPDYYMMARCVSGVTVDTLGALHDSGTFSIVFDRKPQKWLKTGERAIRYTSSGTIVNPTLYGAYPIIRVYGAGQILCGENNIIVNTAGNQYIDIDTEIGDAYEGAESRNGNISAVSTYGTILPGHNAVTFTGFSAVEIIPRWWTV